MLRSCGDPLQGWWALGQGMAKGKWHCDRMSGPCCEVMRLARRTSGTFFPSFAPCLPQLSHFSSSSSFCPQYSWTSHYNHKRGRKNAAFLFQYYFLTKCVIPLGSYCSFISVHSCCQATLPECLHLSWAWKSGLQVCNVRQRKERWPSPRISLQGTLQPEEGGAGL